MLRTAFAGLILIGGAARASEPPPLVCDGVSRVVTLPAAPSALTLSLDEAGSWTLRVDEVGQELELARAPTAEMQAIALRPPRFGAIEIAGAGAQKIRARAATEGPTTAKVLCRASALNDESVQCFARAESALLSSDIDALALLAKASSGCAAFAQHGLATLLSKDSRFDEADIAYAEALRRWQAMSEPARAAAAMLGTAENSNKAQRYSDVLQETVVAERMAEAAGATFFALRALGTRAAALRESGKAHESRNIWASILPRFRDLGEWAEVGNLHYNIGVFDFGQGDRASAERNLLEGRAIPDRLLTPMVKGRLIWLKMELLAQSVSIAEQLKLLHDAERLFSESGQRMWQEIALRRRAHLLGGLGLYSEAHAAMASAFRLGIRGEAPIRVADALVDFGRLREMAGDFAAAEKWTTSAAEIYRSQHQISDYAWAKLNAFRMQLMLGERVDSDGLAGLGVDQPWIRRQPIYCLTVARALILDHRSSEALKLLEEAACDGYKLGEDVERSVLNAEILRVANRSVEALDGLMRRGYDLRNLTISQTRGALRFLALRQLRKVTATWTAIALARTTPTPIEQWWQSAQLSHPFVIDATAVTEKVADYAFSDLAAMPLLGRDRTQVNAHDRSTGALVQRLSTLSGNPDVEHATIALRQLQASLPKDGVLLVPMLSDPASVMLWISSERAEMRRIPGRNALAALAVDARTASSSAGIPVEKIVAKARALSDALLAGADAAIPKQVWLLFHEDIGEIPLSLLTWPGTSRQLVDTSSVSWVMAIDRSERLSPLSHSASDSDKTREHSPHELLAISAANAAGDASPTLSPLFNADIESALIREALSASNARLHVDTAVASREKLTEALGSPGALVHIAAHGDFEPNWLGYSGVWLAPKEGLSDPQFLSWIDAVDMPLHAELAVFNACRLGEGLSVDNASGLSFSGAISAAGVDNVVAALWPVSDAATVKWVPAFYRALDVNDLDSSAEALRQAQLALRNSRHFRHPFYWASLVHFRHLEVLEESAQ